MSDEDRHWRFVAAGWTGAALLFTVLAAWRGHPHTPGVGLGRLLAAVCWAVVLWERRRRRPP